MNRTTILISFICFVFCNSNLGQKSPSAYSIMQLDSILESLKKERAYDQLLPYAQIGVEKAKKELGNQDTSYAKMLYFLGFAYQMQQDFEQGELLLKQAIEIQKNKIPKHRNYAATLHNLAFLYHNLARYDEAKALYREAMLIRKEVLGMKHPDYASSLNNLAALYWGTAEYEKVLPLYKEAIAIRKEVLGVKHPDYANSLNNLAILYVELGQYLEAESLYKQVISTRKEIGGEDSEYGSGLHNLGILYMEMKRNEEAEYLLKESIGIEKRQGKTATPDYAENLMTLASFYMDTDNLALADSFSREAILINKSVFGEKHPNYVSALINLAGIYVRQEQYKEAEVLYKQIIKISKEIFGATHVGYAKALNNLAFLYWKIKKYKQAEPLYKEALAITQKVLNGRTELNLMILNNLAALYKKTGNYDEVWDYIQQAITANIGEDTNMEIDEKWADFLLSKNYVSLNQLLVTFSISYEMLSIFKKTDAQQKQIILSDLALQFLLQNRNSFTAEADKLSNLTNHTVWSLYSLRALDKKTQLERAFDVAEQGKSVLLLEAAQTKYAYNFGDLPDSLAQQEKKLQETYSNLQATVLQKSTDAEKEVVYSELNKINIKIKDFKNKIEKSYPQYAALKYQQSTAKVKDIQQLLDPKTAILEYVIGDSVVYIFYVDKNNLRFSEIGISKKELTNKIKELHNTLSNYGLIAQKPDLAYLQYTKNAYWFYQNLVAKPLEGSKGIEHLVIVTDGELGYLPYEAFLVEEAPQGQTPYSKLHYLVNDYKVSYNYSATLWRDNKIMQKPTNNGEMFAMAATYQTEKIEEKSVLTVYENIRQSLQPLPAARTEVEALSKTFKGFFAFDKMTSERIFKEKAAGYSIIHLAMHGLLDSKAPILSCLAFTENNDSLENDFLQAYEISKMHLNADLVVLSACETGYGKFEKGNGIASLARAFMYAGAPALVVSLWQVNDYSTAELMKNLYNNLATGMPKDQALQEAKIKYISEVEGIAAHPAFWSAFVLIGDESPVQISKKGGYFWWVVGGVGALILGGGAMAMRRKKE